MQNQKNSNMKKMFFPLRDRRKRMNIGQVSLSKKVIIRNSRQNISRQQRAIYHYIILKIKVHYDIIIKKSFDMTAAV